VSVPLVAILRRCAEENVPLKSDGLRLTTTREGRARCAPGLRRLIDDNRARLMAFLASTKILPPAAVRFRRVRGARWCPR